MPIDTRVPCQRRLTPLEVRYLLVLKTRGPVLSTAQIAEAVEVTTAQADDFLHAMQDASLVCGTKRSADEHRYWRSKIICGK